MTFRQISRSEVPLLGEHWHPFLGPKSARSTIVNRVINIWADVICPFCYLGSVWAEQAARELQADLRWLPFEIHPDTPPEGAPKPFSPREWPQVRERLERLAEEVGLPIDPPRYNVNSRFALETVELVRAQKGDGESGAFCHEVSRAFFTEHADISKRGVIVPIAERFGISASDVETAWHERRFSPTVDAFIEDGHKVGVTGVPAMGWPNRRAIVGLMPPSELVLRLRKEAPQRLRE